MRNFSGFQIIYTRVFSGELAEKYLRRCVEFCMLKFMLPDTPLCVTQRLLCFRALVGERRHGGAYQHTQLIRGGFPPRFFETLSNFHHRFPALDIDVARIKIKSYPKHGEIFIFQAIGNTFAKVLSMNFLQNKALQSFQRVGDSGRCIYF